MLDVLVDNYLPIVERVGAELDAIEDRIFDPGQPADHTRILRLKRGMSALRRIIGPQRDAVLALTRDEFRPYLPSILLSGFMFPFHAMPAWARGIGEALPLTHFLRCLRAGLVRGADAGTVLSLATPIAAFAVLALAAALLGAYRRTR